MEAPVVRVGLAALLCSAACGSGDARTVEIVRVAPAADPSCGLPADGQALFITALGDFPASESGAELIDVDPDAPAFSLASFPAATRQLSVIVVGPSGAERTVGKTRPFAIDELEDGDRLAVFMAPRDGFCPTGGGDRPARARPLLARAGAGVLVAGGTGAGGAPVAEVELYDPDTGSFEQLGDALYGDEETGLLGATATTLDDGRVVVAGGRSQAYQVFDPQTGAFETARFLPELRAHHAAFALDGGEVLLAGGCDALDVTGACEAGSALLTSSILDVDTGGMRPGPDLITARIDGTAIGEADGRVVLVGGVDGAGAQVRTGERIDPGDAEPSQVIGEVDGVAFGGSAAQLAGGGVLAAFGPPGAASYDVLVLPGGADSAVSVGLPADDLARAGATLTPLEDGRVLVLGGEPSNVEAVFFHPARSVFAVSADEPDVPRTEHGAIALDDGTVLIVGGKDDSDAPLADAWIFRPDLTGPFTSDVAISFAELPGPPTVVPRNPAQAERIPAEDGTPAHYLITSSRSAGSLPADWVVVAGPRFGAVTVRAFVRATGGGVAVLFAYRDPGSYRALVLAPGQRGTVFDVVDGVATAGAECDGAVVAPGQLEPGDGAAEVRMDADAEELTASIDGTTVLECTGLGGAPLGLVGVGVVGTQGAALRVDSILASR